MFSQKVKAVDYEEFDLWIEQIANHAGGDQINSWMKIMIRVLEIK